MMMKADPKSASAVNPSRPAIADDAILSAFDPVVEGASFQIIEEGLDPQEFARLDDLSDALQAPEVLATFDLAATLARVPEKLFFRIGEVADLLEVKTYVLRFWETEFPMVNPAKSRAGQRVYRKKDVEMLLLIKHLLYVERFSIEGARKRIRELRQKPADRGPAKNAPVFSGDRESLRTAFAELEKLANLSPTIFFRF